MVRASSSKHRFSEWHVIIYIYINHYRCGSFWPNDLCLKGQYNQSNDSLLKETHGRGRLSSVAVLKSCWAAILRTPYHPGEWGLFLHSVLTLLPGSESLVHCSPLLLILSVVDFSFSVILLGHIWNGCWKNMPFLGAEQLSWFAFFEELHISFYRWLELCEQSWSFLIRLIVILEVQLSQKLNQKGKNQASQFHQLYKSVAASILPFKTYFSFGVIVFIF